MTRFSRSKKYSYPTYLNNSDTLNSSRDMDAPVRSTDILELTDAVNDLFDHIESRGVGVKLDFTFDDDNNRFVRREQWMWPEDEVMDLCTDPGEELLFRFVSTGPDSNSVIEVSDLTIAAYSKKRATEDTCIVDIDEYYFANVAEDIASWREHRQELYDNHGNLIPKNMDPRVANLVIEYRRNNPKEHMSDYEEFRYNQGLLNFIMPELQKIADERTAFLDSFDPGHFSNLTYRDVVGLHGAIGALKSRGIPADLSDS